LFNLVDTEHRLGETGEEIASHLADLDASGPWLWEAMRGVLFLQNFRRGDLHACLPYSNLVSFAFDRDPFLFPHHPTAGP
jgi:hypothetical protein